MRRILIALMLFFIAWPSFAEDKAINPQTQEICNQVMMDIYQEILSNKDRYKELVSFGEKALYKNKYGIYAILYQYGEAAADEKDPRKRPFAFGLTLDRIGDNNFSDKDNVFDFSFPPMGFKFSGYQNKHLFRTQFDILPLLKKHGAKLVNYQQQFLPLRIEIKTDKDVYQVREDIGFEITLRNVSKRNLLVDDLNEDTLFFIVDDDYWGTISTDQIKSEGLTRAEQIQMLKEAYRARREAAKGLSGKRKPGPKAKKKGGKFILRPGESLSMKFRGESFLIPREVEIYATYRMKIQDTNPTVSTRISITEVTPDS
jgi:hypothetical protein